MCNIEAWGTQFARSRVARAIHLNNNRLSQTNALDVFTADQWDGVIGLQLSWSGRKLKFYGNLRHYLFWSWANGAGLRD